MGEAQNNYAKWKKLDAKDHISLFILNVYAAAAAAAKSLQSCLTLCDPRDG